MINNFAALLCMLMINISVTAQQKLLTGHVIDSQTGETIPGASVVASGSNYGTITDITGKFEFSAYGSTDSITVSYIGYNTVTAKWTSNAVVMLHPSAVQLDHIIVTANRDAQDRREAPAAVTSITPLIINETKANSLDQILNKVHGVYMVDLGNEQHSMSIRQPLSYGSLFLYMEDGIPIRTTGIFNHNALIEMNMASVRNMEIIKGPSSSLYGSEAIGGAVNFITHRPSLAPAVRIQMQGNNSGYKRSDLLLSNTWNKTGISISGYIAGRNNGPRDHSDFNKTALTLRSDMQLSAKTIWINSLTHIDYKSDMTGGLDSAHFYRKDFSSMHTFTYRKVNIIRYRTTLDQYWNNNSKSSVTIFYRDNSIGQNPHYRVKDDYKPWNNTGNKLLAHGEINESSFQSYGFNLQHKHGFDLLKGNLTAGISGDISPSEYYAKYISINKNETGFYTDYTETDSLLANYSVYIRNTAAYGQLELTPVNKLKFVLAMRYDRIDYNYDNHLPGNAFSGVPDGINIFSHATPKIGFTYDIYKGNGVYANYSVGFTPPDVTELYRGVKIPTLKPSTYINYEGGGWLSVSGNKGIIEVSIYQLDGTNEIVNVKQPDGSFENQNAGRTKHKGIEYTIKYSLRENLIIRFSGANAHHTYIHFEPQGDVFTGNTMVNAPHFISNAEISYRPPFINGSRLALEWQHMGNYYLDEANSEKYPGFNLLNIRAGYEFKQFECWLNILNVTDELYATVANKSAWGKSYRAGEERTFNLGIAYNFKGKTK